MIIGPWDKVHRVLRKAVHSYTLHLLAKSFLFVAQSFCLPIALPSVSPQNQGSTHENTGVYHPFSPNLEQPRPSIAIHISNIQLKNWKLKNILFKSESCLTKMISFSSPSLGADFNQ